MIIALGFAAIMNFVSYWFSDKIVLAMYRGREVSPTDAPRFHAIVDRLIVRAQLPKPKLYILPGDSPNAFATGRNPGHAAVAATEGILRLMSDEELEGVIAHELAHVKNRDILIASVAATIAGAVTMLASMAKWGMIFGGYGGRDRRPDRRHPLRARRRPAEDRGRGQAGPARRQPGHGAHVHRQAVLGRGVDVALQHPSANRAAHPRAPRRLTTCPDPSTGSGSPRAKSRGERAKRVEG